MDQTQDQMKFLGTLGIFGRSFKTIFSFKKLFAEITFTLVFPLALVFMLHMDVSSRYFYIIEENPYLLILGAFQSYGSYYHVDVDITHTDWLNYVFFKMSIIVTIIIFAVLSTCVIVYTIASLYTSRDITFTKAMKAGKSAWKRLAVTLLYMFLTLFAYNLLYSVVVFVCIAIFEDTVNHIIMFVIFVPYVYWSLDLLTIWGIASVVAVLEDSSGLKATIKAMDLMKGKKKTALSVSFLLYLFMGVAVFVYMVFYIYDNSELGKAWPRLVLIALSCGAMFVIGFLIIIVAQTMLFLVCKSHHQETIDFGSSSTYLGAYLSDPQPAFRTREVIQLGRTQNQPMTQV